MSKKKFLSIAVALVLPQLAGGLGAVATQSSVSTWYRQLRKPPWTPPSWIFAPVWTTLYLFMGLASWLVWQKDQEQTRLIRPEQEERKRLALGVYGVQLALNTLWSLIFFGMRNLHWALLEIVVLWAAILETVRRFFRIRPLAGWLLVPYLLWSSFATALNASIWWLNRDTGE